MRTAWAACICWVVAFGQQRQRSMADRTGERLDDHPPSPAGGKPRGGPASAPRSASPRRRRRLIARVEPPYPWFHEIFPQRERRASILRSSLTAPEASAESRRARRREGGCTVFVGDRRGGVTLPATIRTGSAAIGRGTFRRTVGEHQRRLTTARRDHRAGHSSRASAARSIHGVEVRDIDAEFHGRRAMIGSSAARNRCSRFSRSAASTCAVCSRASSDWSRRLCWRNDAATLR